MKYDSRQDEGEKQVPTLRAFIKKADDSAFNPLYPITKIWIPGKFDCFSLICGAFKVNAYSGSSLYAALEAELDGTIDQSLVLAFRLDVERKGEFEIVTMESEEGDWSSLGDCGYSCRVMDKAKKPAEPDKLRKKKPQVAPLPLLEEPQIS